MVSSAQSCAGFISSHYVDKSILCTPNEIIEMLVHEKSGVECESECSRDINWIWNSYTVQADDSEISSANKWYKVTSSEHEFGFTVCYSRKG